MNKLELAIQVAPVRERGLKFIWTIRCMRLRGRSREGAWIEIMSMTLTGIFTSGRSREGAWIEICISATTRRLKRSLP